MVSLTLLKTKLNKFSIFGSFAYGLLCALAAAPEVYGSAIGRTFCFFSAALFYFGMYAFFSHNRELAARLWQNKLKYLGIFMLGYAIIGTSATLIYMLVHYVPSEIAIEKVARGISYIFYYAPFLP